MFRLTFPRTTVLAATLLAAAGPLHANPFETTLENGMKIIVKEDRRAPSVVHMVWYGVGSMDEPSGVSGIAHLLEHMMFKGTEKVGPGEFNKRVAAVGGRDNAFTSHDYTAYFQQVPPDRLGEMMMLEADRMANLKITDALFAPELEVVKEERRLRTEDEPRSLVHEQLMATSFQANPYGRPIIGWMTDLDSMTAADARAWHKTWYAPNNARLVVVGDVAHEAVFDLARKHYGALAAHTLPARRISVEPEQRGPRESVVKAPADLPYVAVAWRTPTLRNPDDDRDVFALQVLAAVLDGYDGARLPRRLVRETRVAVAVGAGYDGTGRGPSLFTLDASPAPGKTVADVEAALLAEIARIQTDGIDEDELQRVKTQTIAGQVYKRDSLMGQAMEIGFLESTGLSWRDEPKLLEGVRRVTAAEVQAVARKYFVDTTRTRALLDPLPLADQPPRPAKPGMRH
ncbi:MAG: pitrilysin family protein [Aromatoleum sp.]|uniref:M16 family metallopeptidase n=1 Tax=Aromatoleum sp. TaxID=2307007 RepID=UPI0028956E19|nr:pitrilysin family protein [Aromatoleum sp.]MDT3670881.1 pitrilysin family protein [Aromatoleum sp.]